MADGTFDWELIDHRLVALKLSNLSEEMLNSIRAETAQIQFDNMGNSNSQAVPIQITAMHLRRTEEWIEKTYSVYCDVWEKQGRPKTAAFIRAVANHVVPAVISARTNGVVGQLSLQQVRTNSSIERHNARMESFRRSMSRLTARCARKFEIEARECELKESATAINKKPAFDQRENLSRAIAGRRAEIERINRTLNNLPTPGTLGRYGQPVRISQNSIRNLIARRLEHEAALAEMESEKARRLTREGEGVDERSCEPKQGDTTIMASYPTREVSDTKSAGFRTPYQGLKPEMKAFDFSRFMEAAKLTDKQFDCYSLVKEYERPMCEVEQRMGITRKTIHEHITAAEKAINRVRFNEHRSKSAAKRRDYD